MNFSDLILEWYDKNKRDLPWRKSKDPYKIWISEIILQQTKISQGTKYYLNFLKKFPNLKSLANSSENEVLLSWQGLGYYSRARNLHKSAKKIYFELENTFPKKYGSLLKLKGIGDYTASAISSICFNEKNAVLDGNVYRILARYFLIEKPINASPSKKYFRKIAQDLIPNKRCGDYNQAIMDYSSMICKPVNPKCDICIFSKSCRANLFSMTPDYPKKLSKNKNRFIYYDYVIFEQGGKNLIQKINSGLWLNMYQFPVFQSDSCTSLIDLKEMIYEKFKVSSENIELINENFINHKLTHLQIQSRFWKISDAPKIKGGLYVDNFEKYPMSRLMHKFFEKYNPKLSLISL
tara:strand:- start:192 stop:1241 length:1050 start_codon:yes stop_codon:yes gene_type:complete